MAKSVLSTIITRIYGIEIEEILNPGLEIDIDVRFSITNSKDTVHKFFNQDVRNWVGEAEYRYLFHSKAWFISSGIMNELNIQHNPFYQKVFYKLIHQFLDSLWLIKDFSTIYGLTFTIVDGKIDRNSYPLPLMYMYAANGNFPAITKFTKEEIERSIDLYNKIMPLVLIPDNRNDEEVLQQKEESLQGFGQEKINKFSRAIMFLRSARSESDLGYKIDIYFSSFECLFATSNLDFRILD